MPQDAPPGSSSGKAASLVTVRRVCRQPPPRSPRLAVDSAGDPQALTLKEGIGSMRKLTRAIRFASAGAAVMAIGLAVTTALATAHAAPSPDPGGAGTWSVSPMNNVEGGHGVGPAVLTDSSTGGKISCAVPFVQFDYRGGMGLTYTLATLKDQSFSQCTLPDGTAVTVTPAGLIVERNGNEFNPGTNLGVTTGRIRSISLSLSEFLLQRDARRYRRRHERRSADLQYYNNPHWLIVRPWGTTLHAYDVSGCGGILGDGDPVTIHAVFDATYLVITSP